jgi:hypothetical protein
MLKFGAYLGFVIWDLKFQADEEQGAIHEHEH